MRQCHHHEQHCTPLMLIDIEKVNNLLRNNCTSTLTITNNTSLGNEKQTTVRMSSNNSVFSIMHKQNLYVGYALTVLSCRLTCAILAYINKSIDNKRT